MNEERGFYEHKGIRCYHNGISWECKYGTANSFDKLKAVIEEKLELFDLVRVKYNAEGVLYDRYGTVERKNIDNELILVDWDGVNSTEKKGDLSFL